MATRNPSFLDLDYSRYNFRDTVEYVYRTPKGLTREIVAEISAIKGEPEWMRDFRLRAYEIFIRKPMPTWGADLSGVNFDEYTYYLRPTDRKGRTWDEVPEEIRRTFERLGIPEAERKFLAGVGAQYECLAGDTRVFTHRGPVPIRDVQPGDIVFSFDEDQGRLVPARVKALAYKGEREVFEVKVGTRKLKATANHPFLVLEYERAPGRRRGRYRRTWKYLYELKPGDLVAVAKRLPDVGRPYRLERPEAPDGRGWRYNPIALPEETSPDLMWWLGLYVGDGTIHRDGPRKARVELAIPASDTALRGELQRVTTRLFGVPARNGDAHRMTVYSTLLARYLEQNGFDGDARTKRVPSWVFTLPRDQVLSFIGGYVDADGYVRSHPKSHDVILTSVNKPLLQDVQALCVQSGLATSHIHRFESKHPLEPTRAIVGYRLQISGEVEQIGVRSPQRMNRLGLKKYYHDYSSAHGTTFRDHVNEDIGFVRVDSITPAGTEAVYDIEVEGPHNFVAEGLIVHNSEVVYHHIREDLAKKGVIFVDTDTAVREYPDLVRPYFGTVVPPEDNKFAALNSAVWSGGSFVYVPAGVRVDIPLQAYFRINAENVGQFERTLIIAEEGAYVHYIEGCLPAGEQVSVGDRWVNVESIKPGDLVVAHTGRKARVRAVMVRPYRGDMLTIRPVSPYNAFRLTPEHPVWVVRRRDVLVRRRPRNGWLPEADTQKLRAALPQYVPAGELEVGDFLVFPKVRSEGHNPKYSPQLLKLLGYYLAEGSAFVHGKPTVSFTFGDHETDVIAEVVSLIRELTGRHPYVVPLKGRHAVNVIVQSEELMNLCVEACGKGAADKRLSEELMKLPPEQIRPLLEAYFRGDGNVCDKGNSIMYRAATASEKLAQQIQELLARQGIFASIQVRPGGVDMVQGRRIRRKDQYIIVYTLDKRWSLVRETDDYFLVPIRAIERTPYEGFVFNLDVEGLQSYLVRGFAVHNCTAPIYSKDSLHSAVVEIIAKRGAHVRYTTIQNWSKNVYNLVTKRAVAYEDATVEWIDGNMGSKVTMKYPCVYLLGKGAKAEILSVAYAGAGQHQDSGGKVIHGAPYTTSTITSKSISKDGGRTTYRGLVKVPKGSVGVKVNVRCDALILDEKSRSDTYPYMEIEEERVTIAHEATVGKISDDQIFYLMSRGLTEAEALALIVLGFIEPFAKVLPMEYAIELNRLIQLEMEGAVG
ncbi:FeS cluster assembly protein SufB [bacterium HR11]|nr:FeS cluster assembly protein SufB [bacterium HR11]